MNRKKRIRYIIDKINSGEQPTLHTNNYGYHYFRIIVGSGKNRKMYNVLAHHVYYCIYHNIEDLPEGTVINHKNFNRKDNSFENIEAITFENIEAITHRENILHAVEGGKLNINIGENNKNSKLKNKEVLEIKDLLKTKHLKQKEIAELYGVKPKQISKIKKGHAWKSVS